MSGISSSNGRYIKLSTVEYCAAAAVIGFGLWVLFWGPDASLSAAAFAELRSNVNALGLGKPYRTVGLSAIIIGALYAVAIKINGDGMYWTPIVRGGACVLVVIFLANLSWSIDKIQQSSTGVFVYGILAAAFFGLFLANLDRIAHALILIGRHIRGING